MQGPMEWTVKLCLWLVTDTADHLPCSMIFWCLVFLPKLLVVYEWSYLPWCLFGNHGVSITWILGIILMWLMLVCCLEHFLLCHKGYLSYYLMKVIYSSLIIRIRHQLWGCSFQVYKKAVNRTVADTGIPRQVIDWAVQLKLSSV